jgi:hypothetical protein
VNCPSISSAQALQVHGFLTDFNGAMVFFKIDLALTSCSSSTHSSGQQSMGGSSPAAVERSRFLVTHAIPYVPRTFLKWPIIRGSLAQYTFFIDF